MRSLRQDIAAVLNTHSAENDSNTPDWILAEYLILCMQAFNGATRARDESREIVHGVNCPKVPHVQGRGGYLHSENDDTPYDVDGVGYCGRCHKAVQP